MPKDVGKAFDSMMATTQNGSAGDVLCPDPSIHQRNTYLQDSASAAALTQSDKSTISRTMNPLGPDGKLSAAAAAAPLRYAREQDLPSFPSRGGLSASAGQAALLAQKDGGKFDLWYPDSNPSTEGLGAANIAIHKQKELSPQLDYGYTDDGRKRALLAATKSISAKPDPDSNAITYPEYPDSENAAHNALNAAAAAHKPSYAADANRWGSKAMQAARVQNLHADPEMFTENPPILEEGGLTGHTNKGQSLHDSAVALAKQMYQQPGEARAQAESYVNLQAAAQKLAAERLAKIDPDGILAYRQHYGFDMNGPAQGPKYPPARSRLSEKIQRFAAQASGKNPDDADFSDDEAQDEAQAGAIRQQMSQFNSKLASVDASKRATDRQNLMAQAEKLVQQRLHALDDKVFLETGKASPALMAEWEAKAKAKAKADGEARQDKNYGKVHIGGGKYMDETEVNAIAAARVQPTLDEITVTAEAQRARDEEIKRDEELKRREDEKQKRIKEQEKAEARVAREYAKAEERRKKDAAKEAARQEKEAAKEAERQAKEEARLQREQELREAAAKREAELAEQREAALAAEKERVAREIETTGAGIKAIGGALSPTEGALSTEIPVDKPAIPATGEVIETTEGPALLVNKEQLATMLEEPSTTRAETIPETISEVTEPASEPAALPKEHFADDVLKRIEPLNETVDSFHDPAVETAGADVLATNQTEPVSLHSGSAAPASGIEVEPVAMPPIVKKETAATNSAKFGATPIPAAVNGTAATTSLTTTTNDTAVATATSSANGGTKASTPSRTLQKEQTRRESRVKSLFGKIRSFPHAYEGPKTTATSSASDAVAVVETPVQGSNTKAIGTEAIGKSGGAVADDSNDPSGLYSEPSHEAGAGSKGVAKSGAVSPLSDDGERRGRTGRSDDEASVEEFEEARDKFEDDKLAVPGASQAHIKDESPARTSSRFQEEL